MPFCVRDCFTKRPLIRDSQHGHWPAVSPGIGSFTRNMIAARLVYDGCVDPPPDGNLSECIGSAIWEIKSSCDGINGTYDNSECIGSVDYSAYRETIHEFEVNDPNYVDPANVAAQPPIRSAALGDKSAGAQAKRVPARRAEMAYPVAEKSGLAKPDSEASFGDLPETRGSRLLSRANCPVHPGRNSNTASVEEDEMGRTLEPVIVSSS